jgi:L-lactate dehydrogenase
MARARDFLTLPPMKVSIVGVGHVGSSLGLALVAGGHIDELVLVGRRQEATAGEAKDLLHASAFTRPVDVTAGGIADTAGSDVIAICAAGKAPGSIREGAVVAHSHIFQELIPPLVAASPGAVIVVTTNPLDTMTTLALRLSKLPPAQVIGSGTLLDTMRLRVLLSRECQIHPHDIRVYVLGEHGDSQFAALSSASSGGARLPLKPALLKKLAAETVVAGTDIYRLKGYTNHGVAFATAAIIRAIALDLHEVMPVCTLVKGDHGVRDVCLSLPAVIGRGGVLQTLKVELTEEEKQAFRRSATVVKKTLKTATNALGL